MALKILQTNENFEQMVLKRALELIAQGIDEGVLGSGDQFPNIKIFIGKQQPIHLVYTLSDALKEGHEKLRGKEVYVGSNQELPLKVA